MLVLFMKNLMFLWQICRKMFQALKPIASTKNCLLNIKFSDEEIILKSLKLLVSESRKERYLSIKDAMFSFVYIFVDNFSTFLGRRKNPQFQIRNGRMISFRISTFPLPIFSVK